jgi:hypothetical protein
VTEKKTYAYLVWNITQKRVETSAGLLPDQDAADAHIAGLELAAGRTDTTAEVWQAVKVEV